MPYTAEQTRQIYDKTGGYCAYCEKRLSIKNYGSATGRGGWHVDHSRSRHNGGTDHMNNLVPACVSCNLDKGKRNGQSYRRTIQNDRDDGSIVPWLIGGAIVWALAAWGTKRQPPAPPQPDWNRDPWNGGGWP